MVDLKSFFSPTRLESSAVGFPRFSCSSDTRFREIGDDQHLLMNLQPQHHPPYLLNQQQLQQQQLINHQQQQHLQKGTSNNMNVDDFEYGPNMHGELDQGCRKCNVMFGSSTELKLHFATSHNRQTFECFVCNKLFLQKYNFLAHIERFHDDVGKSFPCQFCDKVKTIQILKCNICPRSNIPYTYKSNRYLLNHFWKFSDVLRCNKS